VPLAIQDRSFYQNGQLFQMDNVGVPHSTPSQPTMDPDNPATEIMQFTVVKSSRKSPNPLPT